jgi:hypothetical protein
MTAPASAESAQAAGQTGLTLHTPPGTLTWLFGAVWTLRLSSAP